MTYNYPKANSLLSRNISNWGKNDVPMFEVPSANALNQLVGYVKFINGMNGTVLYRGQCKDYGTLSPSGCRGDKKAVSDKEILDICSDESMKKFFQLGDKEIDGWKQYQSVIVESALQHYGAKTFCMDFVDNHWCALWFGLYEFYNGIYNKRKDKENYLYLYMYLADTNGAVVRGMYLGDDSYTVDLRKALPSCFLRPAAQHGWIVRKKERRLCDYDEEVVCVAKIKVKYAEAWLGNGQLLSQDNFFPDYEIDQGYSVLLQRQKRSGVVPKTIKDEIIKQNTIENYHYEKSVLCNADLFNNYPPEFLVQKENKDNLSSISELYLLLLNKGWTRNTCEDILLEKWTERNPCVGQSYITAIFVQLLFGGDIYYFGISNRNHYYNKINGEFVDLTYQEINTSAENKYNLAKPLVKSINYKKRLNKNIKKVLLLANECDIEINQMIIKKRISTLF